MLPGQGVLRWSVAVVLAIVVGACGGGGGSDRPGGGGGSFVLMDVSVGDHDGVPLNEILVLTFSEELDRDTVRPETIQVREGPNYGRQVPGEFRVEGRRVEFFPRLPILPDLSDSGFQPAMDYKVILPGQPDVATVRSVGNNRLKKTTTVRFRTAAAGSPDLFRDNFLDATPPHVQFVNPPDGAVEVRADSEITITFNRRALNPVTVNASNITLTLVERGNTPVHRIVSGVPVLEQTHDSVVVKFVPTFPLADEARYILHVDRRVQDLVGNDIDPGFESEFSIRDEPARFSEFELSFDATEKAILMDPDESTASWNEDVEGALAALFTVAGGNATAGDLKPVANRQIAPADFPRGHEVMSIDGHECDVYNFREISIPAGTTVRFTSAPGEPDRSVVLLSLKPVLIEGTLTVSGGDGQDSERSSTNTKLVVAAGGAAGPGGTQGSDSYDGTKVGVNYPQSEGDAGDVEPGGEGGRGGDCSSSTAYSVAGGGGGGGARTAGLNGTKGGSTTTSWRGAAGKGGRSTDQRSYPVNLERRPNVGGAGGGAGGLGGHNGRGWRTGGGGGGGGGGAITVQSAGDVTVGLTGKILAHGGAGGDIPPGNQFYGGAGGGGAGGSVLIRATGSLNFRPGAALDVAGGSGGKYTWTLTSRKGGEGGTGGTGYIRVEAREDENAPGQPLIVGESGAVFTYPEISRGLFAPEGGGAPSIGQTHWVNLGVFDPAMLKPKSEDVTAYLFNDEMTIEVQMAIEDRNDLGQPNLNSMDVADLDGDGEFDDTMDPTTLSEWTRIQDIEGLNGNGFQFIRTRVTFQLDDTQKPDHPLPYIEHLRIRYQF